MRKETVKLCPGVIWVLSAMDFETNAALSAPIVKLRLLDVPPPGPGLYTVTCAVPPEVMSEARILACKLVTSPPPLTVGVVVRFDPFHLTTDDDVNVLPLTVRVNADPPAVALLGLSEVITGNGAFTLKLY